MEGWWPQEPVTCMHGCRRADAKVLINMQKKRRGLHPW